VPTSVSGQDKGKKKRLAANFPSNQTNWHIFTNRDGFLFYCNESVQRVQIHGL
jgi:hypothetical protein